MPADSELVVLPEPHADPKVNSPAKRRLENKEFDVLLIMLRLHSYYGALTAGGAT